MSPPLLLRLRTAALAVGCVVAIGLVGSCVGDANPGISPPPDALFFPGGLLLDPRLPPADRPVEDGVQYLFVSNGNNDLNYNAATIVAVDLDAFFEAWYDDEFGVYPYCEDAPTEGRSRARCVLDRGSTTDDDYPCRRLGLLPQVVECDESPFVVDSVRTEDFVTQMDASVHEPNGRPRLWAPVRGGPSITYIDIEDGPNGSPDFACGQAKTADGEYDDEGRCSDRFRLTHLRNNEELLALTREPYTILVDEYVPEDDTLQGYRYAYVAHSAGGALTLVDLDGLGGPSASNAPTRPAIVDMQAVFLPVGGTTSPGGFGLAVRPCSTEPPGEDNRPKAPSITLGCERPLVYGSLRFELTMTSFTIGKIEPPDVDPATMDGECFNADGSTNGPFCAGPEDLGEPCTIVCEPRVVASRPFRPAAVDPRNPTSAAAFGDLVFADDSGDKLYAVQTNPGALLEIDTSINIDGETLDIPGGPPIELCTEPSHLELWEEAGLAFASCFRAALLYVVDLRSRRVIETIQTATGPADVLVDPNRKKLYLANSLEASVSVIELDSTRPFYLREIARIGLQDPYSR
jgi:hypothetical protein